MRGKMTDKTHRGVLHEHDVLHTPNVLRIKKKYNRRSIRLPGYDYTQEGFYFVTICTYKHKCLFGKIKDGKIYLNKYGEIVKDEWIKTEKIRKNIKIDKFVIMPNHIHGIIIINCVPFICRGTLQRAPTHEEFGKPVSNSIPTIIRGFKSAVTNRINRIRKSPGISVWQRNYYEHIIRNEKDYLRIVEYIQNNPLKWEWDKYYVF